ncbi:hypothetical protein BDP81DRAFT_44742 [Colletotrichum phormii]|uniref:Uncharacterized protein n=1 Tax=Colletotrichum phormii TaxID=359342 RepID=A0AAJ0ECR4_9PEZI|nr:uncharacterized protein BDP81DRAFT_44742 [Colletotrichum phormii]KAK1635062.1 hypothetical protein BDP81DRAFT_44742 [Colletotrichum phormii]
MGIIHLKHSDWTVQIEILDCLQTFDREEALLVRLVVPFLPQTLSHDSIHLSVCPSYSTKICLLLRRARPPACTAALHRFIESAVLWRHLLSAQRTETLGDAPNLPQTTNTSPQSRHYLLLLLLPTAPSTYPLCSFAPNIQSSSTPHQQVQTKAPSPAGAPHYLTSPHQRAISYLRALGTSSLV